MRYRDRQEAGRKLARALDHYRGLPDVLVLALPRGGVPVAAEIARHLGAPLDLLIVRKLGTPGNEELAMGAIASGGVRVLNAEVIATLGISEATIARAVSRELRELERRERAYRGDRPRPPVEGHTVILVDDGVATGSTILAGLKALQLQRPRRTVVAVPVASTSAYEKLRGEADEVVCPEVSGFFFAIGEFYDDFSQTTDEEVRALLAAAEVPHRPA